MVRLIVKPYVVEDYLKNLKFIQQGVPKEALQGKEIQLTLEDMARWRKKRQEIIEEFIEETLPENLEKYFKQRGWKWNPEEPLRGWSKVKEKLKSNTEIEMIGKTSEIRDYLICKILFRDLSKESREAVVLMFLRFILRNIKKQAKVIREEFRALTGISESKVRYLSRLLWGLGLANTIPKGFPARWYYELTKYGREALRIDRIPDKALEEAPHWARRWFR